MQQRLNTPRYSTRFNLVNLVNEDSKHRPSSLLSAFLPPSGSNEYVPFHMLLFSVVLHPTFFHSQLHRSISVSASAMRPALIILLIPLFLPQLASQPLAASCRSYCGNLTVDYPFSLRPGCGHGGFRGLLFCVNGVLMLHLPSGSYRVLDIDYAFRGLTLHDPAMSDCYSLLRAPTGLGNGFAVEPWRAPFLAPDPDNVFMLIGCRADSALFQGFPGRRLPCRNVSGMGCEEYYRCPAWDGGLRGSASSSSSSSVYGAVSPPECCAVEFAAIRAINVSRLGCEGYSSAYSLAPVREAGPGAWAYGIRVAYALPADHQGFCGACRATGGECGYEEGTGADLCLCGDFNSTSNCDSTAAAVSSSGLSITGESSLAILIGFLFLHSMRATP